MKQGEKSEFWSTNYCIFWVKLSPKLTFMNIWIVGHNYNDLSFREPNIEKSVEDSTRVGESRSGYLELTLEEGPKIISQLQGNQDPVL